MNICDDNHEEVCYSGRDCPACKANEAIESLEGDVASAEASASALQDKVESLEIELEGFKNA